MKNKSQKSTVAKILSLALLLFLQVCYYFSFAQTEESKSAYKVLTSEQLKEDYRVLIKTLKEAYPSLYRYNTAKEVEAFFAQNLSSLSKPMIEKEFFPLIARTAAKVKDEHIIPTPSVDYYDNIYKKQTRFLPFNFKIIGNKLYVDKSVAPEVKRGTELSAINNVSASAIINKLAQYLHRDGYIKTFLYRHLEDYSPTQNQNLFDLFYSFCYKSGNTVALKVKTSDGKTANVSCRTLNYAEYQKFYGERNKHEPPFEHQQVTNTTSYLRISSFHYSYREFHKQDFDTLFEKTFRQLDSNRVQNLILDLRRCEGGDNAYLLLLSYLMKKPFRVLEYLDLPYTGLPSTANYFENTENAFFIDSFVYRHSGGMYRLKKEYKATVPGYADTYPKTHSFKGTIYVLTSGATGSAAGILSSILKTSNRAIFIGEETGGAMEGPTALNVSILVLPHSKIRVEIPHIKMQLATKYVKGRGVVPHHTIESTVHDLINNVDPQYQFALKLANE